MDIIIDPYDDSTGLKLPKMKSEVVLITHKHEDHNNLRAISGDPLVIDGPGEFEKKGVFIYGKTAYHDDQNGLKLGMITMYLIEEDNIKVAHLSDLGQKQLTDEQLEFLDDVDVLLIPIGGKYTINAENASEIISDIEPRVVIPMHYKIPGIKIDLDGVDNFIKKISLNPENIDEFKASKDNFSSEELKLVILNRQK